MLLPIPAIIRKSLEELFNCVWLQPCVALGAQTRTGAILVTTWPHHSVSHWAQNPHRPVTTVDLPKAIGDRSVQLELAYSRDKMEGVSTKYQIVLHGQDNHARHPDNLSNCPQVPKYHAQDHSPSIEPRKLASFSFPSGTCEHE